MSNDDDSDGGGPMNAQALRAQCLAHQAMDAPKKVSVEALEALMSLFKNLAKMGRWDRKTVELTRALLKPASVPRHLFSRALLKEAANLVPCQLGMVWVPRRRVVLGNCAGHAVRALLREWASRNAFF